MLCHGNRAASHFSCCGDSVNSHHISAHTHCAAFFLAHLSDILICLHHDEVVGYCYAHAWKEKAAYKYTLETTVYLSPGYKGKGIGRQLMERLIEECRVGGYHALIACITEGNEASCSLHEKLGFRKVSHFEKVGLKFGRWLDVVDYELIIKPNER